MQDQYIDELLLFDESAYVHDCEVYLNYLKDLIAASSKKLISGIESYGFNSYNISCQSGSLFGEDVTIENDNSSNEKWSSFSKAPAFSYEPVRVSKVLNKPITKKITVIIDDSKSIGEEEESTTEGNQFLQKKTNRTTKICSDCPHKDAKHYAKVSLIYYYSCIIN